jgi:hypothetical protein
MKAQRWTYCQKKSGEGARTQQIKARVGELLERDQDATVMVTELSCQNDDCPEVETVIAIFRPDQPKIQISVHSSMEEITDAEIERYCRDVPGKSNQPEETTVASEQPNNPRRSVYGNGSSE